MSQPEESGQPQRSEPPERLAIAGAGTIACGLALAAGAAGVETAVWARSDQSRQRAEDRIEAERDRAGAGAADIVVTCDLDDLSEATLAVEAVAEEQEAKEQVLRALAERVGEHALLASTTSSLAIEALAQAVGRPERFFGLHVFNPVLKMELVEVCFPDEATPTVRERASAFCAALGKTAIEVPDEPGFVVNRLLFPYLFDAVRLLERSGLEPEQIDACMKLGASYPMGPLELLDFVGIDVADAIGEALHADTGDPSHRPPGRIKQLVGDGRVGRKAGRGFYDYRAARKQ